MVKFEAVVGNVEVFTNGPQSEKLGSKALVVQPLQGGLVTAVRATVLKLHVVGVPESLSLSYSSRT